MSSAATELQTQLASLISLRIAASCEINDLAALSGGANNQSWRFSIASGTAQGHYILRLSLSLDDQGMAKTAEAALQQAAGAAQIPVATVRWVLRPEDGIGDGYIMDVVEGETIPRRILRNPEYAAIRPELASQCGQHAARIHALDPHQFSDLELMDAAEQLLFYRDIYQQSHFRRPVMELAFRWLEDNIPAAQAPRLVHGDFRNGNFIVGPEGIRAILDWELAHLGDPMEDLGWLCVNSWRFGVRDQPVGGFGQRQALFSSYQHLSGIAVDPSRVHYWEVLGTLKWGIMCIIMSSPETADGHLTVERAAIGRRTSETELDLLELIQEAR